VIGELYGRGDMQRDISSLLSPLHFQLQGRQGMQKHISSLVFPLALLKRTVVVGEDKRLAKA
jgi:hypothetical protein